jgi:hypothetical protein
VCMLRLLTSNFPDCRFVEKSDSNHGWIEFLEGSTVNGSEASLVEYLDNKIVYSIHKDINDFIKKYGWSFRMYYGKITISEF